MPLDDNDKKAINEMIAEALGGDDFTRNLGRLIQGTMQPMEARFDALEAKGGGQAGSTGGSSGSDHPTVRSLQAQLERMRQDQERVERERRAAVLDGEARAALAAAGVPQARIGVAMSHLTTSGALRLDDDGTPAFIIRDAFGEDRRPIPDGIQRWLDTAEGSMFVPSTTDTRHGGQGARRTATHDQLAAAMLKGVGGF